MSIFPTAVSYTDKDFDGLRARLVDLILSVHPDWPVDIVQNYGQILLESFAFCGDVLTYYQDQQAREGRWGTLVLRKNFISLSKLITYELSNAGAATADVTITITNAAALTFPVTKDPSATAVIVRTDEITDPIRGELTAPVTFSAGETQKIFTWTHALTQPTYIVASNGKPDQQLTTPFMPFLADGSEVVSSTVDGTFARVTNFLNSTPTDLHYVRRIDQNNRATFKFGDGRQGKVPAGDIRITYRTGGGIDGNVEPGALKRVETALVDAVGNTAHVTATNAVKTSGGLEREEVNAGKINGPASLRVLTRTVAREDYEINARRVDGVGRALMLTSNQTSTVGENHGKLYIVPFTGGTPAQVMLDAVLTMCTVTYPNTTTFQLAVLPAAYKSVDVRATVWLLPNQVPSTVKAAVQANLDDFFEPMLSDGTPNPNVDFGYNYRDVDDNPAPEIPWSDVFNVVRDTTGVRKVDQAMQLNSAVDDVTVQLWEFPAMGTLTLINGATGGEI